VKGENGGIKEKTEREKERVTKGNEKVQGKNRWGKSEKKQEGRKTGDNSEGGGADKKEGGGKYHIKGKGRVEEN